MDQQMAQLHAQVGALMATIQSQQAEFTATLQNQQVEFTERLAALEHRSSGQVVQIKKYEEIKLIIEDAKEINLDLFKSIPKFDGNKAAYRSWRSQVWTFMESIKNFQNHPKYYSALGIIRTKIIGSAADILTNHNTKMNFYAIISRLDYTFADQRPLYVLLEEMKKITQGRKTLDEFHSDILKALSLALSKTTITKT